jgi:putative membrane protein
MIHGYTWGGMHSYGMGFAWIIGLILLVLVIVLIIRSFNQNAVTGNQSGNKQAIDILKERYARGEINKEEFELKKKDIL